MSLIRINRQPTPRQLVVFGLAWLVFLGAWAIIAAAKGSPKLGWILAAGAVAIPLAGLFWPRGLRHLFVGLSYATSPIGLVVSYLVLGLIYFLVFTPIGMIMRLVRHDPLHRQLDRTAATYWRRRDADRPPAGYFRQY